MQRWDKTYTSTERKLTKVLKNGSEGTSMLNIGKYLANSHSAREHPQARLLAYQLWWMSICKFNWFFSVSHSSGMYRIHNRRLELFTGLLSNDMCKKFCAQLRIDGWYIWEERRFPREQKLHGNACYAKQHPKDLRFGISFQTKSWYFHTRLNWHCGNLHRQLLLPAPKRAHNS